MKMSREARKIFNELDNMAIDNGVQGILIPAHIYVCDKLILSYYTAPIINVIKSRFKSISKSKREWKHFTIEYWEPMIHNMLKTNQGVCRNNIIQHTINDEIINKFEIISKFLITDYSIQDALLIHTIVHNYTEKNIINACNMAKNMNIFDITYINGILEKEKAKESIKLKIVDNLANKIERSNTLLNKQTYNHSPIDLAMMEYNWNNKKRNAELEKMFNNITGGSHNEI